jgi:hypothetical protein
VEVTDDAAMEWVAIDEADIPQANSKGARALEMPKLIPITTTVELIPFAHLLDGTEDVSPVESTPAATSGAGKLVDSRYLGQIRARIERAWLLPRTPIGAARFACQVRIEQDPAGNVTEVALERCNGSPRWQLSLVHAIESASPLPVPSDPAVFAHAIHMSFQAAPPDSAVEAAQYEPPLARDVGVGGNQPVSQQNH